MNRRAGDPWERWHVAPDSDCWIWEAGTARYGTIQEGRRGIGAHRWFFERLDGPIPEGLTLDHLCGVPRCVNPDHLEPVTQKENLRRGRGLTAQRARQTHCVHGHPFDEANTYIRANGCRSCRMCGRIRAGLKRNAPEATAGLRLVAGPA